MRRAPAARGGARAISSAPARPHRRDHHEHPHRGRLAAWPPPPPSPSPPSPPSRAVRADSQVVYGPTRSGGVRSCAYRGNVGSAFRGGYTLV
ncbi:hypothetical protein GCM10009639_66410 [Kitasatospora putterlickiae]|uniref:Uncharacterized protein n=1 Tax=Kitasatospora putterlickiae TaxID=221725 RepID=A0ABN1YH42_9ACTN